MAPCPGWFDPGYLIFLAYNRLALASHLAPAARSPFLVNAFSCPVCFWGGKKGKREKEKEGKGAAQGSESQTSG